MIGNIQHINCENTCKYHIEHPICIMSTAKWIVGYCEIRNIRYKNIVVTMVLCNILIIQLKYIYFV